MRASARRGRSSASSRRFAATISSSRATCGSRSGNWRRAAGLAAASPASVLALPGRNSVRLRLTHLSRTAVARRWPLGFSTGVLASRASPTSLLPAYGLLRELEEALRALTPIPERRVAPSALGRCEVGIEDRTLLVPLRPLGARHLTYYQSTRRNLLPDVLELRLALRGCSLLHSPHLQSLVAESARAVISPSEACADRGRLPRLREM